MKSTFIMSQVSSTWLIFETTSVAIKYCTSLFLISSNAKRSNSAIGHVAFGLCLHGNGRKNVYKNGKNIYIFITPVPSMKTPNKKKFNDCSLILGEMTKISSYYSERHIAKVNKYSTIRSKSFASFHSQVLLQVKHIPLPPAGSWTGHNQY